MTEVSALRELANLVSAGLSPSQALEFVNRGELLFDPGADVDSKSASAIRLQLNLATQLGAPIGANLTRLADGLESQLDGQRKIALAFATPKLTAKLIGWLPVVSIGLAQLLGLNPIGAIFSNAIALVAVILGGGLLTAGHFWSKRLLATAEPDDDDPGLFADCIAIALEAGLPNSVAQAETLGRFEQFMGAKPLQPAIDGVADRLEISIKTGAAAVNLLRSAATALRRDKQHAQLDRITKLSVKLLLPIGATILPAFGLLTIVPVAVGFLVSNK